MLKQTPTSVADLKAAPYNPRMMTEEQFDALKRSMLEFGDLSGIVLNVRTGHLVGGHQRVKGLDPAWVIIKRDHTDKTGTIAVGYVEASFGRMSYREVDWPLDREKAANLAANKNIGTFDPEKLAPLLRELTATPSLFESTGFTLKEANIIIASADKPAIDEDTVPSKPAESFVKPGQVIKLGPHRLLCADATRPESWQRLFGDVKASLCITDPPFGVEYAYEHGKGYHLDPVTQRKKFIPAKSAPMAGDDTTDVALRAYPLLFKHLDARAAVYICTGTDLLVDTINWLRQNHIHYGLTMVWDKGADVVSWNRYHPGHENIIFCGEGALPGGSNKRWFGPKGESTVWHIAIDDRGHKMHRAQKPVALYKRAMINSSASGEIIVDPFAGSGSCLIAADELDRRAYLMEVNPVSCDIIVNRYTAFKNREASRP